ncbi:MAG: ATP-grasp domain-containing protein, partial [Chloroflexota bacterium]|nr:ATP-grasp domain-containing protein [Chloroflexota bacterium]
MTALIFNCDFNGLALIQELGRRGVDVRALDTVRSVGTVSRYARFHRCPDPLVAERAFVDFLMELGSAFQSRPVLFPTNDHWAAAVSRHREELARLYHPCVAAWSTVELVIRKDRFARWAEAAGYPVPRSWDAMSYGSVPEDAFPLAAKPIFRRISSDDAEGTRHAAERERLRLAVFRNRAELERFSKDHRDRLNDFL